MHHLPKACLFKSVGVSISRKLWAVQAEFGWKPRDLQSLVHKVSNYFFMNGFMFIATHMDAYYYLLSPWLLLHLHTLNHNWLNIYESVSQNLCFPCDFIGPSATVVGDHRSSGSNWSDKYVILFQFCFIITNQNTKHDDMSVTIWNDPAKPFSLFPEMWMYNTITRTKLQHVSII